MANLVAYQSGNFTAATTFKGVAAGTNAVQAAVTGSALTTVSNVGSVAFTTANNEVLEGVLCYCKQSSTTGTVDVIFSSDGTTETRKVTVNATDLPTSPSWVFFKFSSTYTTANTATNKILIKGSSAGNATFYTDATANNWARLIRNATAAAPAGSDSVYIAKEWTAAATGTAITVTMNSTSSATIYGPVTIGNGGTLAYGTSASTAYHLKLVGNLNIYGGGTFTMGTAATPVPITSTAKLEFSVAALSQYGLNIYDGGTFNAVGVSRTAGNSSYYAKQTANITASSSTSVTVDRSTGWKSGDTVVFVPTEANVTDFETKVLSADATISTLTWTGAATYSHSGTQPRRGEVALLTRNVSIFGVNSSTSTAFIYAAALSTVYMRWTECYYLGSTTAFKYGVDLHNTVASSVDVRYCSFHDFYIGTASLASSGVRIGGTSETTCRGITFSNNVVYYCTAACVNVAGPTSYNDIVLDGNLLLRPGFHCLNLLEAKITVTNNFIVGAPSTGNGIVWQGGAAYGTEVPAVAYGNVIHNCNGAGVIAYAPLQALTFEQCEVWHTNLTQASSGGILLSGNSATGFVTFDTTVIKNSYLWGNRTCNVYASGAGYLVMDGVAFDSTSVAGSTTATGYMHHSCIKASLTNCSFSQDATKGVHTTSDIAIQQPYYGGGDLIMNNCIFGSSTEVQFTSSLASAFVIGSQAHDQTSGNHKYWRRYGAGTTDTTLYKTASPSERVAPNNATNKMESGSKRINCPSGVMRTVTVWVRTSDTTTGDATNYNGNTPRLRVRKNYAAGYGVDATLDAPTSWVAGTWTQLTGTITTTSDGVMEVFVDCDGTTGWVNIDDWSVA